MFRQTLLAVLALGLSACVTTMSPEERQARDQQIQTQWMARNCTEAEAYPHCKARIDQQQAELREQQRQEGLRLQAQLDADPAYQAHLAAQADFYAQQQVAARAQADWIAYQQKLTLCTGASDLVALSIHNFWGGLAAGLATGVVCMQ